MRDPYISVEPDPVDVHLSDFEDDEIITYVCESIQEGQLGRSDIKRLREAIAGAFQPNTDPSLVDQLKGEVLVQLRDKFTLQQLEQLLEENG